MMWIKSGDRGAKVNGIQPEMVLAFLIASSLYDNYVVKCVMTEATGGKHSEGSLHYVGLAIDLRTRDMTEKMAEVIVKKVKEALGDQYDVVLEKDHIHIEFQPK